MRHLDRAAPRVPADHGLACLGLLMQLAGNVFAAFCVAGAVTSLVDRHHRDDSLWLFILFAAGVARALVHGAAGTQLVYGTRALGVPGPVEQIASDEKRLAGVRRYVLVAVVHAVLIASVAVGHFDVGVGSAAAILGALLVWPVALATIITRPSIRVLGRHLPASADRGFEAVAIVMTVLASAGLVLSLALLGFVLDLPFELLQQGPALMALVMFGAFVVRSGVHLQAGIAGLRETSIDRAVHLATRYATFGVISTFCAGAVLLLCVTIAQFDLFGLAIIIALVWMLIAWPLIVRRFFSDRQFDDLLAGDDAIGHHRAPDAGLSGLGWLIAGASAIALAWILLVGADSAASRGLPVVPRLGGPVMLQLAVVALGGWAAAELVRMTSRARFAAIAWACASVAVALLVLIPSAASGLDLRFDGEHYAGLLWWAGQIVLGVAAMLLVTRRLAPAARARYRVARSTIAM